MAALKRYGRRVLGLALTSGAVVAGVVWAGPAHADVASFLKDLHGDGIHDVDGGDATLVQVGQEICQQVWAGVDVRELKQTVLQTSDARLGRGGLSPQQASDFVNDSVNDLCP
ncbi:DUF732 domain-containing protein [Mycobacterium sp. 94-17]|uniref:DUF732 domain-containing protein n=1 Tax=Mycobacterium sp. 94-17 TaxID=2986147 RepID=UPI002D1F01EE|nr:DUF732 domain-containing protein [Mycobacterium sp. 94-17]MEB4211314.1 DUF732 domain-containing protein [Mycobacterium sp. 94-17]